MMEACPQRADLCRLDPGTTITLAGTVAQARILNTSLGPYTAVWLDRGPTPLMYLGDVRSRFVVGAGVSLPLAIKLFRYNGLELRAADEYPYPGLPLSVANVLASISWIAGVGLEASGGGPDAITVRVATHRGEAFPLALFRLSLVGVRGPLYVGESGYLDGGPPRDEIEGWTPTGNGTSPQGWLSFVDAAGNGLLDIGDRITIRGVRPASPLDLDSRLLIVSGPSGVLQGILAGLYYWYGTSRGMLSFFDDATPPSWVTWGPESFTPGPPEAVDRFQVIASGRTSGPFTSWRYLLSDDHGETLSQGPIAPGPFLAFGLAGTLEDRDGNGAFSLGDRLVVRGGTPRETYHFQFVHENTSLGFLDWRSGFGMFTGRFPLVAFSNVTRLNATSIEAQARVAGGFPFEESRNFTLRLREGGTPLLTLNPTAVSTSVSGITMTYLGGGDPTLFDAGDRIRLDGLRPGLAYTVEVFHEPRSATSGVWTFTN